MSAWPPDGSVRTHDRWLVPPVRGAMRGRRRWTRMGGCLLVAAALVVSIAPAGPAAAATTDDDPPSTARIVINGLQAVVGPADGVVPESEEEPGLPSTFRARVLVENLTDEPLDGLRLVLTVHEAAGSRSGLRAALDGTTTGVLGRRQHLELMPLEPIPPGRFAQLEVSIDAAEAGMLHEDDDVSVHPVVLAVDQGISVLDEVRTTAVGVTRPIARPLETVAMAALDGPAPAIGDIGGPSSPLLAGGRLDRILRALESAPAGTVTVAPAAHALEDLQRLVDSAEPGATDMLARLRAVVADRAGGLASTPYALADVPALVTTDETDDLATAAIAAGRQRLLALAGRSPDAAHLLVPGQTPASLDLAPADVLVSGWDDTAGPDLDANPSMDIPPALRTSRSRSGRVLDVLMGDPWISRHLATATGAHGWGVDAHRVVAETAMTFAQAPGREGRVLAVVPPLGWDAPGRLADQTYARLARAPWLRLDDPATVAARGRVDATWEPAADVAPERTALLSRVGSLQDRLAGLSAAVADLEEPPDVVTRGDDLLRATSVWPTEDRIDRAQQILDSLAEDIDAAIGEVVVPPDSGVTLASERGVIPVTVQHPEGVPMDVVVEVTTSGRLTFPEGTTREVRLEEGGTATVSFEATALGRGNIPLAATVRTPTGDVVLARRILQIRASAVSRPALLAIGGVVLVLLVVGRRRRPDRPRLEVVR